MAGREILQIDGLTVEYRLETGYIRAVDNVSLRVSDGEVLGIAGESGSGKTTLALTILKLLPANAEIKSGRVIFNGREITGMSEEEVRRIRWREVSIVFQNSMNSLNPVKTVGEQIAEPLILHLRMNGEEARERAEELMELVGIGRERYNNYPHELSGGQRQRVAIAMAIACNPKLVIADEPVTALDVVIQAQIIELLKELRERLNISLLVISHNLAVLAELCDRVAVMQNGRVVEYGDVYEIFENPQHPYTKLLISSFPSLEKAERI